jgi:hypothetical protein
MAGLYAILDPLLILFVDLGRSRWLAPARNFPTGDAFKLYWFFQRTSGSGTAGVVLLVFLYLFFMTVAAWLWLSYLWKWHLGGVAHDLLRRISGLASALDTRVPWDAEIAQTEISDAVAAANRWRGPLAERRVTAVVHYSSSIKSSGATLDTSSPAITSHVSIHTLYHDPATGRHQPQLYRHFLRLPFGACLELPAPTTVDSGLGPYGSIDAGAAAILSEYRIPALERLVAHARAVLPRGEVPTAVMYVKLNFNLRACSKDA